MDIDRILLAVTCVTSTLTFLCVTIAILPRMKEGMVVVRDVTLWMVFGLIVACIGWGVWQNLQKSAGKAPSDWLLLPTAASQPTPSNSGAELAAPEPQLAVSDPEPSPDPYYRRRAGQ